METDTPSSAENIVQQHARDEISLIEIFNVLLCYRRVLVLLPLLIAAVIGVVTFIQPRSYSASASFMPQIPESRSGSGAAALARQFGVNIGGERSGGSPQFYADLLRSRDLLRKTVETEYAITDPELGKRRGTLLDFYGILGSPVVPAWQEGVVQLNQVLKTSVDQETGVIQIGVSTQAPELSEQILQRLLELVNDFNLESRQIQAREEVRFISARMKEVQAELLSAKTRLQSFLQANRQFRNSPELLFKHDDLERDVLMYQGIFTALAQAHEQSRIDAVRDTPLLTLINDPAGSGLPDARGAVRKALLAFAVVLLMTIMGVFILELGRRSRREEQAHYREFQRLVREARKDLRSPLRWFSRRTINNDLPNVN